MKPTLFLSAYVACVVFTWGSLVAHTNHERLTTWRILNEPFRSDVGLCAFVALASPIGTLVTLFWTNFCQYGWRIWPEDARRPSEIKGAAR